MPKSTYPRTKKGDAALIFGHSLLHSYWYKCLKGKCPKNWPRAKVIREHARHVKMMLARGMKHNSPLKMYRPKNYQPAAKTKKQKYITKKIRYKNKDYEVLFIPVVHPAGIEKRYLMIAPESLQNEFYAEAYEKVDDADPSHFTEQAQSIDNTIFEYHPDWMIKQRNIPAIIKNLYDDIRWKWQYAKPGKKKPRLQKPKIDTPREDSTTWIDANKVVKIQGKMVTWQEAITPPGEKPLTFRGEIMKTYKSKDGKILAYDVYIY